MSEFEQMSTQYASVDEDDDGMRGSGGDGHEDVHDGHFEQVQDGMVETGMGTETAKPKFLAALFTEFTGTFFLCSAVSFAVGSAGVRPLAIGWMLTVCVYAGGHLSGAHYNPAVTLCAALCTKLKWSAVLPYWAAQVSGALSAGALAKAHCSGNLYHSGAQYPSKAHAVTDGQAFLGELLISISLCFTVCSVAFAQKQAGNSFFGYAIGFTVVAGAAAVGPISGGAFNPAVGCLAFFHSDSVWIYWLAPCMGAGIAAVLYWVVHSDEIEDETLARFPVVRRQLMAFAPYLMELIGTFYLCLIVGLRGTEAYEVGAILTAMVFAGGCVSGANFNPAVTLALVISGGMEVVKAVRYVGCQLLGALLAAWTASALTYKSTNNLLTDSPSWPQLCTVDCHITDFSAIILEAIATFALIWTVLNVAVAKETAGNSFFGFAIGMMVFALACMFGGLTGGAFNPAVGSLGLFHGHGGEAYIYWVGNLAGSAAAAFTFNLSRVAKTAD